MPEGLPPPFSFPVSSASLHPSPPPLHHRRGHLHPLAVFRNCSNFLPCDPEPGSSPRHPQAGAGVSAEPPARRCAAAAAAAPAMGERCDYQRLSSAEEEEEMLGPLPHSFSDSTGQRALRTGSRHPAPSPQQDVTPGMPCRRVSVGGVSGGHPAGLGLGAGMGLGGSLHGISPLQHSWYPAVYGVAWAQHPPLHGCTPVPTHRSGAACCFLLGKLRQGGMARHSRGGPVPCTGWCPPVAALHPAGGPAGCPPHVGVLWGM